MRRRDFIAGLTATVAWPCLAWTQGMQMRRLRALRVEGGLPAHQRLGGSEMLAAAGARFSEGRDCISSLRLGAAGLAAALLILSFARPATARA